MLARAVDYKMGYRATVTVIEAIGSCFQHFESTFPLSVIWQVVYLSE